MAPVGRWRQGRVECLERVAQIDPSKLSAAIRALGGWAERQGLKPTETDYVARTRDRRELRFTRSDDPAVERAYRTHWFSPELSERERQRLEERQSRAPELVVISPLKDWTVASFLEKNGRAVRSPTTLTETSGSVSVRLAPRK
jgi:hypothetical protein